jgi:hypothetical protein
MWPCVCKQLVTLWITDWLSSFVTLPWDFKATLCARAARVVACNTVEGLTPLHVVVLMFVAVLWLESVSYVNTLSVGKLGGSTEFRCVVWGKACTIASLNSFKVEIAVRVKPSEGVELQATSRQTWRLLEPIVWRKGTRAHSYCSVQITHVVGLRRTCGYEVTGFKLSIHSNSIPFLSFKCSAYNYTWANSFQSCQSRHLSTVQSETFRAPGSSSR